MYLYSTEKLRPAKEVTPSHGSYGYGQEALFFPSNSITILSLFSTLKDEGKISEKLFKALSGLTRECGRYYEGITEHRVTYTINLMRPVRLMLDEEKLDDDTKALLINEIKSVLEMALIINKRGISYARNPFQHVLFAVSKEESRSSSTSQTTSILFEELFELLIDSGFGIETRFPTEVNEHAEKIAKITRHRLLMDATIGEVKATRENACFNEALFSLADLEESYQDMDFIELHTLECDIGSALEACYDPNEPFAYELGKMREFIRAKRSEESSEDALEISAHAASVS